MSSMPYTQGDLERAKRNLRFLASIVSLHKLAAGQRERMDTLERRMEDMSREMELLAGEPRGTH